MKILYFDCFSGISGDMTVGALIDAGVPQDYLTESLEKLGISGEYDIKISKDIKSGISGTSFNVELKGHTHEGHSHALYEGSHDHCCHNENQSSYHHGRNFYDVEKIIKESSLHDNIKNTALKIFGVVAKAESKVHNKPLDEIHFHEVGAIDSIVDIVSTAIAIDYLKPDRIISSSINTGKGFVKCAHGTMPVPAPAVMEILRDVPIYYDDREFELTTPTGAAIIKALVSDFEKPSAIRAESIGYGCGKRDTDIPNVLRVITSNDDASDICLIEATIDDMNPQIYGYLMDELFSAGAKDVYYTPVYMKKNRPGILLTVVTPSYAEEAIKELVFRETTTIGIRKINMEKSHVSKDYKQIETELGRFTLKISKYNDQIVNISPEYEELLEAAKTKNIPLKQVYSIVNGSIRDTEKINRKE